MPQTLLSLVQNARTRFGDKPFAFEKASTGWTARTFNQIFDDARTFAAYLLALGCAKGSRIAIFAEGSPNWIVAEYGAAMAACIAVPLSFKLLPEEIAYRLEHSEASVILTNHNHIERIHEVVTAVSAKTEKPIAILLLDSSDDRFPDAVSLDSIFINRKSLIKDYGQLLDQLESLCSEDDTVTISYTSGTTGNPKGIMLTHRNYYINSLDSVEIFEIPEAKFRDFIILPIDHSFAQTVGIHASVQRGIEVWFVDSRGGGIAILRNIPINLREAEPVFMMTVPALSGNFMKKIREGVLKKGKIVKFLFELGIASGIRFRGDATRPKLSPDGLLAAAAYFPIKAVLLDRVRKEAFGPRAKFFSGGGASFDLGQQRFFRALGLPLYQGYGMTEASPVISSNTHRKLKLGTSGVAIPNVTIRIMKEDGTLASPLEKGEIQVSGPNLMKGYFKNPEATAETLVDGWLKTGDLGFLDSDGFLTVEGRAKALLISSDGEKYSPEGIETAILESGKLISQVLVYNDHRKFTSALITLDEDEARKMIKTKHAATPEAVLELIKESFYAFRSNQRFKNTVPLNWTPSTFQIIDEQFSESNGLINSTLKIIRYKVIDSYSDLINYIYSPEGSTYKNDKNIQSVEKLLP